MTHSPSDNWVDLGAEVVGQASFPGYTFHFCPVAGGALIDAYFQAPDNDSFSHTLLTHFTRRWFVPKGASRDAIACTILKLVLCSLEHEAREQLRFNGVAVFHPHKALDFTDVGLPTPS